MLAERTTVERELYEQVVQEGTLASQMKRWWKSALPALAGIAILLLKFKTLAVLLALKAKWVLVTFKLTSIFTTAGSMLLSIGLYAVAYGFYFAVGLVLLLFVHEMGHVLMLRRNGIRASAPLFIPFFGAFVAMKEMPRSARIEAEIGLGGPLLGTLGALVVLGSYYLTGHGLLAALAYVGFLINLFNLIPMTPLDGGRIVVAISRYLWLLGAIVLIAVFVATRDPFFLIILFFAGSQMIAVWRHSHLAKEYYDVSFPTRIGVSMVYFSLVALLGVSMASVGQYLANTPAM